MSKPVPETPVAVTSQEWVEETIGWWVTALGLEHWRIEAKYDPKLESSGRTWAHEHYMSAQVLIKGEENHDEEWVLKHWPTEETIIHELVHLVFHDYRQWMLNVLVVGLPKDQRKVARNQFDHFEERIVEVLSRALVNVANQQRSDPSPSMGGVMTAREDKAA